MKKTHGRYEYDYSMPFNTPGCQPSSGKIMKHRVIAQRNIGRPLTPQECVVQIDGDCYNLNPDNIIVFANLAGVKRFRSRNSKEFLFQRQDGVFDYDWEKVKMMKQQSSKRKEKLSNVKQWVSEHPQFFIDDFMKECGFTNRHSAIAYLCHNDIEHMAKKKINNNLFALSRKEVIEVVKNSKNLKETAKTLNVSANSISSMLRRRGISFNNVRKFEHIDKETLNTIYKMRYNENVPYDKIVNQFNLFEENILVELKRNNYQLGYSFVNNDDYIMPTDEDYLNDENIVRKSDTKIKQVAKEPIQQAIKEEIVVKKTEKKTENSKYDFANTCKTYNIHWYDIKYFESQTQYKDILMFVDKLKHIRNILTPYNIEALLNNNYTNNDIADIYNFDRELVDHVIKYL